MKVKLARDRVIDEPEQKPAISILSGLLDTRRQEKDASDEPEPVVSILIGDLDRFARGELKFDGRFRQGVANRETGWHTLRVKLEGGQVRKVLHTVEDEI